MRYTPMSVGEFCVIEMQMLDHFKLLPDEWKTATNATTAPHLRRTKQLPNKAKDALSISQSFFSLTEIPDAPIDCEEMVLAIRYRMGYGFWAWFFFKNFAIPIIKWLWVKYHSPTTGDPAHDSGENQT